MFSATDVQRQFLAAMATRNLALAPGKQLIADGQWHRCEPLQRQQQTEQWQE
jgi:hypothetical protein